MLFSPPEVEMPRAEKRNLITGELRFNPDISKEQVVALGIDLKRRDGDERYHSLILRDMGENRHALAVVYEYDGSVEKFNEFRRRMSDEMRRRFPDGFVGLEISGSCLVIQ